MGHTHISPSPTPSYHFIEQVIPQQHSSLSSIQAQLCLQSHQIYQIYEYFNLLDNKYKGFLQLDDFIEHFSFYDENFIELPYLEYLFTLIKKNKTNIVFFQEFIRGMTVFCLMNKESILQFVFDCIDKDDDNRITKEDIKKFLMYQNPKTQKQIFFTNFYSEIDQLKLKQNQTIFDFQQFRSNSDRLNFLIWPAYKLQQTFRKQILGTNAWYDLYSKAEKKQYEIKNNQKKQARLKEKLEILNNLQRKEEGPFFKNQIKVRKCNQVNTDIKMEQHIERQRRNSCPYIKPEFKINIQEDSFSSNNK